MRWTVEQERILFEHGNRGAKYCAELIARRYHVRRTPEATRRHAYRIGIPMAIYETCHECGRAVKKLNRRSGLCPPCHAHKLWLAAVEEEQEIITNLRKGGEDDAAYKREKRRYDAQRQKNSRLRKQCGDSVGLSTEMSHRRSEAQEIFEPPDGGEKDMRPRLEPMGA